MENSSTNQIKVGLFVALGIVVVGASILLLGGDRLFFKKKVALFAEFDQVQGLAAGSVVSLAGISIGNIQEIEFIPEQGKLRVNMRVDAAFIPRVTEGTSVEIRTQGALGDKFIYIIPGDPAGKSLGAGAILPMQKSSDLMGIISERGKEADKVFEIINELYRVAKSLNADNRFDHMIQNIHDASVGLKQSADQSSKLIADLREHSVAKINDSTDKLDRILTKIDRGEGTLGALINDSSLHESIKNFVGGSERKKNLKSLIRGSIEKSEKEGE